MLITEKIKEGFKEGFKQILKKLKKAVTLVRNTISSWKLGKSKINLQTANWQIYNRQWCIVVEK